MGMTRAATTAYHLPRAAPCRVPVGIDADRAPAKGNAMSDASVPVHAARAARPRNGWLLIAAMAIFGALAIEQGVSLLSGHADLKTRLLAWATSDAFIYGDGSLSYMAAWYQKASVRMALHMGLGGVALGLGALQFVPSLRQRHPRWHRASGLIVWLATGASMSFALAFLVFVPAARGASGIAFQAGLWSLSGLTLILLAQAVMAAFSRDFRSHMIWMALVYAALLTAPILRVDWVLIAWLHPQVGHEWNNLGTGVVVLPQTLMLMALWLDTVGDRSLPGRPAPVTVWPRWLMLGFCIVSAAGVVQEAFLGGTAADPFAGLRQPLDQLPHARWLWGAATLSALLFTPASWRAALAGGRPPRGLAVATGAAAAGALLMGLTSDQSSLGRFGSASFWIGYAALLAFVLAMASRRGANSVGRNAWLLILLTALWLPSQIDGLVLMCLRIPGGTFAEAYAGALAVGIGGVLTAGIATGFGARWRWWVAGRGVSRSPLHAVDRAPAR